MPIGAAIGGAVIGAGGSIIAGGEAADAQRDAARSASDTSAATTAANNALAREIRGQNLAIAQPFYNQGSGASGVLNGLLGVPQAPALASYGGGQTSALGGYSGIDAVLSGGVSASPQWGAYLQQNPDVLQDYNTNPGISRSQFPTAESYAQWHYANYGQREGRTLPSPMPSAPAAGSSTTPALGGSATGAPSGVITAGDPTGSGNTTPAPALTAWDTFRNSTNYQFRLGEGQRALNAKYAANGMFQSGAADKALEKCSQNFASNELANYMNLLANQQQVGLSAGNAVMGVNTAFGNTVAANNQNQSNVAANAALASGNASAQQWGTVGNVAGQLGGALFQYGMGGMGQPSTGYLPAQQVGGYTAPALDINWGRGF